LARNSAQKLWFLHARKSWCVLLKSAVSTDNVDYSPSIFFFLLRRYCVISLSLAAPEEAYRKD